MVLRLLAFLFLVVPAFAQEPWFEGFCKGQNHAAACGKTTRGLPEQKNVIPLEIQQVQALRDGALALLDEAQEQTRQWGDFTRWLKGDQLKGGSVGFQSRWDGLESQARAILEARRELRITTNKLNLCHLACSPATRVKLEERQGRLERIVSRLLYTAPWWMSEDFLEFSNDINNQNPSSEKLKSLLASSMADFFTKLQELKYQAWQIQFKSDDIYLKDQSPKDLLAEIYFNHPQAVELILKRTLPQNPGNEALCSLGREQLQMNERKELAGEVLNMGLLAGSLLVGPGSVLGVGVSRAAAGAGFFARARAFMFGAPRAASLAADFALSARYSQEYFDLKKECESELLKLKLNASEKGAFEDCLERKNHQAIEALLAGAGSGASAVLPLLPKVHSLVAKQRPALKTKLNPGGGETFSIFDLSRKNKLSPGDAEVPGRYWDHVGEVYKKRLNLSEDEVAGFVASSKAFESRTKLVVATRGPPSSSAIEGGVAIVHSEKAGDLLPLEKATGMKLPRSEGKIIEVVRLNAESKTNKALMVDLLKEIAHIAQTDEKIKKVYIYTSKVHARLYKRLKVPYKQVGEPIDRDVVIEVSPADLAKALAN